MTEIRIKPSRQLVDEDEEKEDEPVTKAKRHDIEIPTSDVDLKLAEKLDNCLKLNCASKKVRFLTNKTRDPAGKAAALAEPTNHLHIRDKIQPRNLTKDELRERLIKKYDSLVPELDPQRHNVKVVKILSANESMELGKNQARKQLERQLELNSVSGNQLAIKNGLQTFKFNDGYEMPMKTFATGFKKSNLNLKLGSKLAQPSKSSGSTKTVKFAENSEFFEGDDDDEEDEDTEEEMSESDCSTICE